MDCHIHKDEEGAVTDLEKVRSNQVKRATKQAITTECELLRRLADAAEMTHKVHLKVAGGGAGEDGAWH